MVCGTVWYHPTYANPSQLLQRRLFQVAREAGRAMPFRVALLSLLSVSQGVCRYGCDN